MNRFQPSVLASAVAAALCFSVAHAEPAEEGKDAPKNEATELTAVTVTARKREETLQEVPVAVTAFTEKALEEFNVGDIGDLDTLVPNLTVYAARGSSSTVTAYIRAIGQSDPLWGVDPGVGIYLDDVYIARPQGALLDVLDVDRIEVLRGPQGTLYGKNTIGGAIKYITKPLLPDFSGRAEVTVGTYGELDVKGSINTPLGSDKLVARVALASLNRDGFGENRFSGQDVSDKEINVARVSVGAYPSPELSFVLSADWLDDQSGVRGAKRLNAFNAFDPAHTPPLDDRYDILSGMPNVNDTQMHGVSLTANWKASESWWLKSVTAYRKSDTDTNIDFDELPLKIVDVLAKYHDDQFSQEFQGTYDGGGALKGVVGLYYFNGTAGGTVFNNFLNRQFGTTNGEVDTKSIALYGEGTWSFTDRLALTGGLRYTSEDKSVDVLNLAYANASFVNPIATAADFDDSKTFTNVSPKLSLDYKLTSDVLLYALISKGFKSGGFNIRANTAAVPASKKPFDDESVTSFEVGSKTAWFDGRLYLNAAYFYNRYKDIQLSVFSAYDSNGDGVNDAFFGDFTNAGRGHVQGVELELAAQPTEHWTIQGNLGYLDSSYDEFISRGVDIANTQIFTNAPKNSWALSSQYTFDLFGGELAARATYAHQSKVYPTTDLSEVIAQPGYGIVNAGLLWRADGNPWTVSLQGTNLTDREYRTTGYNIPVLGILTGFYGAPRQVTLSVGYAF
jgi:iron complex outermembrane receptor protein